MNGGHETTGLVAPPHPPIPLYLPLYTSPTHSQMLVNKPTATVTMLQLITTDK